MKTIQNNYLVNKMFF